MNVRRMIGTVLWSATATLTIAAVGELAPFASAESTPSAPTTHVSATTSTDPDSLRHAGVEQFRATIGSADPFRADHTLPSVRFGTPVTPTQFLPPKPPKPALILRGVVGGHDRWQAMVDGIPGHDGAVLLSVGDTAFGLRATRITESQATVVGFDTTWTLHVHSSWP